MSRTGNAVKKPLQIRGFIFIVGVIGLLLFVYYLLGDESEDRIDGAPKHSIDFALNASGLGKERLAKVVRSFESGRKFIGDGYNVYEIKLIHVSVEELLADSCGERQSRFFRGDQLPDSLVDAIAFSRLYLNNCDYAVFPDSGELRSKDLYGYAISLTYSDDRVYKAELIFVRPSDSMLYFFSGKI